MKWSPEDLYGYDRAYKNHPRKPSEVFTVLDPTAGGGSIPFEALRLGHRVIANELNPVAAAILYATLDYPARYGPGLVDDIEKWGRKLLSHVEQRMEGLAPFSPVPHEELNKLRSHLQKCPELIPDFDKEYDHTGLIFARQVTCPSLDSHVSFLS